MAKYKKKRARELKHDRFRDATMLLADRLADRVGDHRKQILYGLIGLVVVAIGIYAIVRWRHKHADEAASAMGRAIAINDADISLIRRRDPAILSSPVNRSVPREQFRSSKRLLPSTASHIAPKLATSLPNELVTDRLKAETDLQNLTSQVVTPGCWPNTPWRRMESDAHWIRPQRFIRRSPR